MFFLNSFHLRLDENKLLVVLPEGSLEDSKVGQLQINMKLREEFDINTYSISVQQFMDVT